MNQADFRWRALLTAHELSNLRALLTWNTTTLCHDGWSAALRCGTQELRLCPAEVATPTDDNSHADVTRLQIERQQALPDAQPIELGRILRIAILRVAVHFTPPVAVGPGLLLGVELPAGHEYSAVLCAPDRATPSESALVDAAISLVTTTGRVVVGTDGVGFWVHSSLHGHGWYELACVDDNCVERVLD